MEPQPCKRCGAAKDYHRKYCDACAGQILTRTRTDFRAAFDLQNETGRYFKLSLKRFAAVSLICTAALVLLDPAHRIYDSLLSGPLAASVLMFFFHWQAGVEYFADSDELFRRGGQYSMIASGLAIHKRDTAPFVLYFVGALALHTAYHLLWTSPPYSVFIRIVQPPKAAESVPSALNK